ncbi:hypothetical protein D3C77_567270 [compost metagenome]
MILSANEPDIPVPQLDQMLDSADGSGIFIGHDPRQIGVLQAAINEHERNFIGVLHHFPYEKRIALLEVDATAHEQDAIHPLLLHNGQKFGLFGVIAHGIAKEKIMPCLLRFLLRAGKNLGKERVRNIRKDDSDNTCLFLDQASG